MTRSLESLVAQAFLANYPFPGGRPGPERIGDVLLLKNWFKPFDNIDEPRDPNRGFRRRPPKQAFVGPVCRIHARRRP
jgi:hypothetical protein